ncbi:MAG: hypothetical protein IPM93_21460 [Candidatus Obscuribacter sp.]|nr:hypothetical protein [Candidatus Obscuribacter sp.]
MNKQLIYGKLLILVGSVLAIWASLATVRDDFGFNTALSPMGWQPFFLIAGLALLTAATAFFIAIIISLLFRIEDSWADSGLYLLTNTLVATGTASLITPSLVHGALTTPMVTFIGGAVICTAVGTTVTIKALKLIRSDKTPA